MEGIPKDNIIANNLKENNSEINLLIKNYIEFIDNFQILNLQYYTNLSQAMSKFANSCNLKKNIINKPFFQLINSVKNMFEDYSNTMKDINGAQMTKLTDSLEYLNNIIKDLDKEFFEGPNLSN